MEYKVSIATCGIFSGLLIHLTVVGSEGREVAKEELEFHIKELSAIRSQVKSRVVRILGIYAYLQDLSR